MADIFRGHVKKNPNKVLLVYEDREWTGAQVRFITIQSHSVLILLCEEKRNLLNRQDVRRSVVFYACTLPTYS